MVIICVQAFHAGSIIPTCAVWYVNKELMETKLLTNHFLN